jgi:hypothetical protein
MCSPRRGGAVEDSKFVCQFGCCEGHGERMPPMEGPCQGFYSLFLNFVSFGCASVVRRGVAHSGATEE